MLQKKYAALLRLPLVFLAALLALTMAPLTAAADEGWVIKVFDAQVVVDRDGSMTVTERLDVDFRGLAKHGIFRDIPIAYAYQGGQTRFYDLSVTSVTNGAGRGHQYSVTNSGTFVRIKIGDPNVTISGSQTYVIVYTVRGALNGFADHDELFWNASGNEWPVAIERGLLKVTLPSSSVQQVACFQGATGSKEACTAEAAGASAQFASTRLLPAGEGFTVVAGFPKGVVSEPAPILRTKPREGLDMFRVTPLTLAGAAATALIAVFGLGWAWWTYGRDKAYTSVYYLTRNPEEETAPLFKHQAVVVEYAPPEGLRPAEIGVLLDESADTIDVSATIIDLAARGFLRIEEYKTDGVIFGLGSTTDWRFVKLDATEAERTATKAYERKVYSDLFLTATTVTLASLKNKFYTTVSSTKDLLYQQVQKDQWFPASPESMRNQWRGIGIGAMVLGGLLAWGAGREFGASLVFVPVVAAGLVLVPLASVMPRRTAMGSELLRRSLGFREYLVTAETHRQQFNEQKNTFAKYLPYAMVFNCVHKWSSALAALGVEPSQAFGGWYVGYGAGWGSFATFGNQMSTFSDQLASTITSTPGGSGSSGFGGGGSSGGGGGGGGGGSW